MRMFLVSTQLKPGEQFSIFSRRYRGTVNAWLESKRKRWEDSVSRNGVGVTFAEFVE